MGAVKKYVEIFIKFFQNKMLDDDEGSEEQLQKDWMNLINQNLISWEFVIITIFVDYKVFKLALNWIK